MTNQQHFAIAAPQVGPGKGAEAPLDLGRFRESQDERDMYAFRVPSLHNVAASRPWMHDGAFNTLEAEQMADAVIALLNDPSRRQTLGQNARQFIEEMWTWAGPFLQLEKAFFEALDAKGR